MTTANHITSQEIRNSGSELKISAPTAASITTDRLTQIDARTLVLAIIEPRQLSRIIKVLVYVIYSQSPFVAALLSARPLLVRKNDFICGIQNQCQDRILVLASEMRAQPTWVFRSGTTLHQSADHQNSGRRRLNQTGS